MTEYQHAISDVLNQYYVQIGQSDDINECECVNEVVQVEQHRNHDSERFIRKHLEPIIFF